MGISYSLKPHHDIFYAKLYKKTRGREYVPFGKPVMYHVTLCEVLRYYKIFKVFYSEFIVLNLLYGTIKFTNSLYNDVL